MWSHSGGDVLFNAGCGDGATNNDMHQAGLRRRCLGESPDRFADEHPELLILLYSWRILPGTLSNQRG